MKKLLSKLKHPVVAITALSLAAICFLWFLILPDYPYKQTNGNVSFTNPHSFSTSKNNYNVIVDGGKSIYCTDEKILLYTQSIHYGFI